ncbi:hypothetical protein FACS189487_00440 [Campylobacterota bacterium]|nr:hypothetical protein FACS189487_00440 [Campylobacterota bacterium]
MPLSDYADFAPSIERMAAGEAGVLFAGRAAAFEQTSGSSGAGKLIPYSAASFGDFSRALLPWIGSLARRYELSGSAYWAISPALRAQTHTAGGVPIGVSDALYLGAEAVEAFAAVSAVPSDLSSAEDAVDWQRRTCLALLLRDDLQLISVWSPTFFLALLDAIELHAEFLAAHLHSTAQHRLKAYLASGDTVHLWADLRLVSCWRSGASRTWFDALQRRLPQADFQAKGLLSTEGVVTVPNAHDRPLLAAHSGFFEFLDSAGEARLAHELRIGEAYEAVITTAGGLYRYRTGDLVCCTDIVEGLPMLDFLGRTGLFADLVGEKLSEAFAASCLPHEDGAFRLLVPVLDPHPHYALIVDDASPPCAPERVEQALMRNPQYAYARRLGQLQPLRVIAVREPLQAYLRRLSAGAARVGDVKLHALRPETDWLATFGTAL